ncbi:MAG: 3-deoxy-manno-octulosonate cytidylyltransferase [Marinifilaceae bacterium]|jgi:3-deoxy-manno-octulosonate cytidylyltransferase (CMP-KDO synthetase)|nr:3-deoxy-manno-octulosonate cytidylyltransferase [Marinifilaceae bacterium]
MKYICIIPARYASSRFEGKPLAMISGKTMIERVYRQAQKAIDEVWVATDDSRIEEEVVRFGGKVIMTSDKHNSGTDRIAEAINNIQNKISENFDVVINIQGDEPLINPEEIQNLANCFQDESTQIATMGKKITDLEQVLDPNVVKLVKSKSNKALYFSRSTIPFCRDAEKEDYLNKSEFIKHIGVYAYRTEVLQEISRLEESFLESSEKLEQLRWLENSYTIEVVDSKFDSIGVDTPEDLANIIKTYFS